MRILGLGPPELASSTQNSTGWHLQYAVSIVFGQPDERRKPASISDGTAVDSSRRTAVSNRRALRCEVAPKAQVTSLET